MAKDSYDKGNLDPGKVSGMTPTEIYEKVSDAFEDTDSKIGYLKEIQNDLKEQHPNDYKKIQESINTAIGVLGYEKDAEKKLEKGYHEGAANDYIKAYELDPENEEFKNKAIDNFEEGREDLKPGEVSRMTPTQIYEKVSDAFDNTDSKIGYLKEIQKDLKEQRPDKYEELSGSLDTTIDVLNYEKAGEESLERESYYATEDYEKALELDPENEELKNKASKAWEKKAEESIRRGNFLSAGESYEDALRLDPKNEELRNKAIENYKKGAVRRIEMGGKDCRWGIERGYEKALKLDPENVDLLERLSRGYEKLGENQKAMNIHRKIKNLEKKKNK